MNSLSPFGDGVGLLLVYCALSGYALVNTTIMQKMLPNTYGSADFFRILAIGYIWLVLAYGVLAQFPELIDKLAKSFNKTSEEIGFPII